MVADPWLVKVLARLLQYMQRASIVFGVSAHRYRALWRRCCNHLRYSLSTQLYGLRRGGATHYFQTCSSFSRTADRGRWASERAMKVYITSVLTQIAAMLHGSSQETVRAVALLQQL